MLLPLQLWSTRPRHVTTGVGRARPSGLWVMVSSPTPQRYAWPPSAGLGNACGPRPPRRLQVPAPGKDMAPAEGRTKKQTVQCLHQDPRAARDGVVTAVQLAARGTALALTLGTDVCLACPETAPQTVSNALPCVFAQNQSTDPKSRFKELFLYTPPPTIPGNSSSLKHNVGGDQGHFLRLHIEQVDF